MHSCTGVLKKSKIHRDAGVNAEGAETTESVEESFKASKGDQNSVRSSKEAEHHKKEEPNSN